MEKTANDNLIGNLYALRAGLSLVEEEKQAFDDKVDKAKATAEEAELKAVRKITAKEEEIERQQRGLNYLRSEYDSYSAKAGKGALKKRKSCVRFIIILASVCAVAVVLVALCIWAITSNVIVKNLGYDHWLNNLVFPGLGIFFIIACISIGIFIANISKWRAELRKCLTKKEHLEAIARLPGLSKEITAAEEAIQSNNGELSRIKDEAVKEVEQLEAACEAECEMAKSHALTASEIVKTLDKEYSALVDARDWTNLDLIIYSLETRRADNMKEALKIVDEENRSFRLVAAINQASEAISRSINAHFLEMNKQMNAKFNELSNQINLNNSRLSGQITEIANETNLNKALLSQANKSSVKLAESVEQIRNSTKYIEKRVKQK